MLNVIFTNGCGELNTTNVSENINCLLIDDDLDDHEFFSQAMKDNYPLVDCDFATNRQEVISGLENHSIQVPQYIFMDWSMPNIGAEDYIRQLHELVCLKDSRIFILSGYLPELTNQNMRELGIEKFLLKQNSIGLLSKELDQAFRRIA